MEKLRTCIEVQEYLAKIYSTLCDAHNALSELDFKPSAGCVNERKFFEDMELLNQRISGEIEGVKDLIGFFL